ncbi:hypothetical protein FDA94_31475 [Herbidospora galbida]|uniref:Uncharacterized protein n=1 Tax=Herbidospora galbida TaxID=2575442 RepID=A0A4U3M5A6_9ACTN|nr:hypothetical protein [Herbidospora galbida]TKK84048.1 hypothetical protein FDA94_31475 [Herbidospora galbida]
MTFLHQRTQRTTPGADHRSPQVGPAGAYIDRRRLTYPVYLTLLRDHSLNRYLPAPPTDAPTGTASAILLSIDQAERTTALHVLATALGDPSESLLSLRDTSRT